MTESLPQLDFTGERFTPECVREIWYEHWHRYAFARSFAAGKRVLDAACGEGYGSALLANVATSVLGVDIAQTAIEHARKRYATQSNLTFVRGDCTELEVKPGCIDLVVSFETLEHVAAQEALINGFARALSDDGILIVSSPDKRTYSDANGFRNEFHVRELYRDELLALLGAHFPHVRLFGQKLLFQSAIWSLDGPPRHAIAQTLDADALIPASGLQYDPLYFIALCSRQPLPSDVPELALFGDREESVYRHYNDEVRKNMRAGTRIAELEAELAALRTQPVGASVDTATSKLPTEMPRSWWRRLLGR
ncbi:MAG TPA: class I SAM-dependent methyltransferase [Rudaea sp.]|nr:class I SAM-dependent methyltransferase [Rudaea sp.]